MFESYIKVVDYCVKNDISLYEFEKICKIPVGTISNWQVEKPNLNHFIKVSMMMHVSPFWLESGMILEEYDYRELCVIYILRNTDSEGYESIIKTALHQAYKEPNQLS